MYWQSSLKLFTVSSAELAGRLIVARAKRQTGALLTYIFCSLISKEHRAVNKVVPVILDCTVAR